MRKIPPAFISRGPWWSPRTWGWTKLLLLALALVALACNSTRDEASGKEVVPRFVLGGWVLPGGKDAEAQPRAETLRGFVITTEEELRDFLDGVDLLRIRGNLESLDRVNLAEQVILAAYYLWRPLKGDPLSVQGIALKGDDVEINMELLEDPQGRESPYLLAPLYIVALDKDELLRGVPLSFSFLVSGEVADKQIIILE